MKPRLSYLTIMPSVYENIKLLSGERWGGVQAWSAVTGPLQAKVIK